MIDFLLWVMMYMVIGLIFVYRLDKAKNRPMSDEEYELLYKHFIATAILWPVFVLSYFIGVCIAFIERIKR